MAYKMREDPDHGSAEPLLDKLENDFELDDMAPKDEDSLDPTTSYDEDIPWPNVQSEDRHLPLREDELTIRELINCYPMAIFWSVMVSVTVIMEGFDMILIGNFYAYPTFQKKYGTFFPHLNGGAGGYQLTAGWQAFLSNAAAIGSLAGSLLCGYLVPIFGKQKVLIGGLIALAACIFVPFFAPNIGVLAAGEVLCGIPWAMFATISPAYASEVLPRPLRVYLTSWTNMCFVIGQFIAMGVLAACVHIKSDWAFRIPFALQWVWPTFLVPLLLFCPESPYHLVQVGQPEKAEAVLKRLARKSKNMDTKATLDSIVHTNNVEKNLLAGVSYWDCIRGTERRRTIIACIMFSGQILCGSTFAYNSTYFFEQIGLKPETTYNLALGGTGLALFSSIFSWFVVLPYFGRRTIYLWGLFVMVLLLFVIGLLAMKGDVKSIGMMQAVLTLCWTFIYQNTVGQLGWAIPAEIGSTRLRQQTVCLARNAYYVVAIASNIIEPFAMNPTQWNLKGYTGFIWCGTAAATLVWGYFKFPETKGRSAVDVDLMFAAKVPARKFKTYVVDSGDAETLVRQSKEPGASAA